MKQSHLHSGFFVTESSSLWSPYIVNVGRMDNPVYSWEEAIIHQEQTPAMFKHSGSCWLLQGYSTTIHTLPSYLSSNNKAIMALSLLSVLCIKMQILTLLWRSNTFLSFANNMQHLRAVMELVVKSLTLEFLKA